mmetsp:Transcript_43990/g.113699  ORF Transcript_43990/g.113699 Transcript_43990/m.113699 type:complete len:285 (-) Transcript_43990:3-857(-)
MPHLIIERERSFHTPRFLSQKAAYIGVYAVEVLDIFAAATFVGGSLCFLPRFSKQLRDFVHGCSLFILGSAIYCLICTIAFGEALGRQGWLSFEVWEHLLYLLGSWLFLAGSVLYLPVSGAPWDMAVEQDHIANMGLPTRISIGPEAVYLGQICELFSYFERQSLGTILFIVGSMLYVFAAFTNALNQRKFDELSSKMLTAVTSLYMTGSLLFTMGSVALLPHLGCGDQMVSLGVWCFIIGSFLFLFGGIASLVRTHWVLRGSNGERDPLMSGSGVAEPAPSRL